MQNFTNTMIKKNQINKYIAYFFLVFLIPWTIPRTTNCIKKPMSPTQYIQTNVY